MAVILRQKDGIDTGPSSQNLESLIAAVPTESRMFLRAKDNIYIYLKSQKTECCI